MRRKAPTVTVVEENISDSDPTTPLAAAFAPLPLSSPLTGKFDLYATQLTFLRSEYLPNFQAVYEKILLYQAKSDFSFRCALRTIGDGSIRGRFTCDQVVDPMSDEPLESLCILGGQTKESVNFGESQSGHRSLGSGWGFESKMKLGDSEGCGCGLVDSASGTFKLRKVWEAPGDATKELFEGYWSLKVVYGPTLRRKGHGSGESYSGSFWGVRALKKDGEEIGIDAGDGMWFVSDGDASDMDDEDGYDDSESL